MDSQRERIDGERDEIRMPFFLGEIAGLMSSTANKTRACSI